MAQKLYIQGSTRAPPSRYHVINHHTLFWILKTRVSRGSPQGLIFRFGPTKTIKILICNHELRVPLTYLNKIEIVRTRFKPY